MFCRHCIALFKIVPAEFDKLLVYSQSLNQKWNKNRIHYILSQSNQSKEDGYERKIKEEEEVDKFVKKTIKKSRALGPEDKYQIYKPLFETVGQFYNKIGTQQFRTEIVHLGQARVQRRKTW